jgi:transcriptional regulator with XRE-family HTH domain
LVAIGQSRFRYQPDSCYCLRHPANRSEDGAVVEDRRAAFCARIRAARERKGITLDTIAARTKINRSLLKGLEHNDLSRWPQGLFRRSYLRDYLRAIDLLEDALVSEFIRLFPDPDAAASASTAATTSEDDSAAFALTLAEDAVQPFAETRTRLRAAALDLAIVLVVSSAAWSAMQAWSPIEFGVLACGLSVAIAYHSIGTVVFGRSIGSRLLEDRSWRRSAAGAVPAGQTAVDTLFDQLRGIKGLGARPQRSMMRRFASVAANVAFFRVLFFR